MALRILFHVQHLLGIGHQRRSAAIARELAVLPGARVDYVSGGMPVPDLDTGECVVHQLPAAAAEDGDFRVLVDCHGRRVDERWKQRRRDRLLSLLEDVSPALIVTETFPFGRGLLRFELLPLLEWARHRRVPLVCSVRDIIEPRNESAKLERMCSEALRYYAAVLVHGDERVLPFRRCFPPWRRLAHLLRPTGYVLSEPAPPAGVPRDGPVLVSCGGGRVGDALLDTAVRARSLCRLERDWELRVGQGLDAARVRALQDRAGRGVVVARNRGGFVRDLASAAVSVSQAGYNTVAEVMASATPCVLVPYAGEQEQGVRARAFEAAGAARVLAASRLTPARLARAVEQTGGAAVSPLQLKLDGLSKSVQHIRDLLPSWGESAGGG